MGITWWTPHFGSMTHYDITIGNDFVRDVYYDIIMGSFYVQNIYCDIIMGHDIIMGAYNDVTMNIIVAKTLLYQVSLCLIIIFLFS